jgi:hypothetical protein
LYVNLASEGNYGYACVTLAACASLTP